MRIVLVSPQYRIVRSPKSEVSKNVHRRAQPVLGLAIVGTALKNAGHEVLYLDSVIEGIEQTWQYDAWTDCYGLKLGQVCKRIEDYSPDIVGLTCLTTSQYPLAKMIGMSLEQPVIIGGNHASLNGSIFPVVAGEADLLSETIFKRLPFCELGHVENMDDTPFIDWSLVPLKKYWEKALPQNPFSKSRKTILYETSRGCPEHCSFCSTMTYFGNKFRPKSSRRVIEEITRVVHDYGVEEVQFCDDSMAVNRKRFLEICEGLAPLKIHLCNPSGIRFYSKDEKSIRENFKAMADAGFYQMTFAVESGNEHILNNVIGKRLDLNLAALQIKIAKEYFPVHVFLMIGLPGETIEQIEETRAYAKKIKANSYSLSLAQPFPRTRLADMCELVNGVTEADMLLGKQVIKRDDGLNLEQLAEEMLVELNSLNPYNR